MFWNLTLSSLWWCSSQILVLINVNCCLSTDPFDGPQSGLSSSGKNDVPGLPQTLQQEFSLVNLQIRNVNVEVSHCNSDIWNVMLQNYDKYDAIITVEYK